MMPSVVQTHISLAPYTTLGVGGYAHYFVHVTTKDILRDVVQWASREHYPITVIGGGSNILVSDAGVAGVVLYMDLKGVAYDCKSEDVRVTVGAGVALDTLIDEVVERGMWGLENLSAIPGSVGAVPVQNVGAYGVEASDVIHEVYAYDCSTHEEVVLTRDACRFGYRDSLFKQNEGKRYIITAVVFRLSRIPSPHLGYKDLAVRFPTGDMPTLSTIRDAVIEIRKEKFPDWHTVGTAGSFFKNPVITRAHYAELCERYPELPGFPYAGGIKIPLGWILDRVLNLRGYREGSVGLYEKQALVLVHHGGGTANEIYAFSERIITRVYEATGVQVEREVVCV